MSESELQPDATVRVPSAKDFGDDAPSLVLNTVPTEILCNIFRLTLPWHRRVRRFSGAYELVLTPPWRLALVCRRWREIALGDPSLWSHVVIEYLRGLSLTQIEERYPLAALEAQLSRSGTALLDVTLATYDGGQHELDAAAQLLGRLEVLVRYSHRLEGFSFGWKTSETDGGALWQPSSSPQLPLLLAQMTGHLPHLRRLHFTSYEQLPPETSEVFRVAPQLREVFLTEANRHGRSLPSPHVSAPWEQITHFSARLDRSLHLAILRRTEHLVECRLNVSYTASHSATPPIVLPHLRRLSVSGQDILLSINAPNLQYLFLSAPDMVPPFIQRSQCSLKGFTVYSATKSDLLYSLTTITSILHLHAVLINADGITQLLQDVARLCPQLASLSLHLYQKLSDEDHYALYDSIVAGWTTLRFVAIGALGLPPAHILDRFFGLRSDGLQVVFSTFQDSAYEAPLGVVTSDMVPP
ncbi:hypothetical protein C8R46DRAFT_1099686 [Mycena filopes]|nr:hypothetical protein C8R46DRAFT_1099686 [Mycena filopes]